MDPAIAQAALRVNAARAVIDGEIVAVYAQGRPGPLRGVPVRLGMANLEVSL